jgi:hypothetical protein
LGKIFTITRVVTPNISFYKYYTLVSDIGEEIGWLDSTHFMPLSEIRLERLQELGI